MDMHDLIAERREEMLAVRCHPVEDSIVDQGRPVLEASLGAADADRLAGKSLRLIAREAMERMTFGHSEKSAMNPSAGEVAQYVSQSSYARGTVTELGELVG